MGGDKEDVIQEGMIGIFKAIRQYRDDRNTSFRTFAELCITRQIISAIRKANLRKHSILNESVSLNDEREPDGEHQPLEETLRAKEDMNPEALLMMKEVSEFLKAESGEIFSPLEKKVWARMLQGKNYREIAAELHRSSKTVDNAMQRIKKKIYGHLGY